MKTFLRKYFSGVKINKVIEYLTFSDILMMSGWGLISPIIAVFFTDQIVGGSVEIAGFATATYFLTKSIVQVPVARYIDLRRGEWDDFWVMITGSLLITFTAFLYIFIKYPWQVYVVQAIYGIGGALSYPSWLAIFTRHIDKKEEGFEWSIYFTTTDIGAALTSGLGGLMVTQMGYKPVFAIVGVLSFVGTLFLAGITHNLKKRG